MQEQQPGSCVLRSWAYPVRMDELRFWEIIERSLKKADGANAWDTTRRQAQILVKYLAKKPVEEILDFDRIFRAHLADAYVNRLWCAVYVIYRGRCDILLYDRFVSWLIAQGQELYYLAIADPDELASVVERDIDTDDMLYVASRAYQKATGEELDTPLFKVHPGAMDSPSGSEALLELYPRLMQRFW